MVGVFDRSHYEDVLIHRVHRWASPEELERRYAAINEFEARQADAGHQDRQGHAQHQPRRAEGSGCWPGWMTRRSCGSTAATTSRNGPSGTTTWTRTRRPSRRRTPSRPLARGPGEQEVVRPDRRPAVAAGRAGGAGPAVAGPGARCRDGTGPRRTVLTPVALRRRGAQLSWPAWSLAAARRLRAPSSHSSQRLASASPRSHSARDSSRLAPPASSRLTTPTSCSRASS